MANSTPTRPYNGPPPPGNPRKTEAWALTQAAYRLRAAAEAGDKAAIRGAVRLNWRLWTILQAELLDPECLVPEDLRANMLALANFVDKRSVDAIARPSADKLAILISVNREVAAGLFTDVEGSAADMSGVDARLAAQGLQPRTASVRIST